MTMTLEQVRDVLINEAEWYESRLGDYKTPDFRAMADAIATHLSQPQPVAQGEAVVWRVDGTYADGTTFWFLTTVNEMLSDRHTTEIERNITPLYRVLPAPVGDASDVIAYVLRAYDESILRTNDREDIRMAVKSALVNQFMDYKWGVGQATPTIPTGHRVVPVEPTEAALSRGLQSWEDELNSWTSIGGTLDRKEIVESIYKAMLAAAPDAGGV